MDLKRKGALKVIRTKRRKTVLTLTLNTLVRTLEETRRTATIKNTVIMIIETKKELGQHLRKNSLLAINAKS